MLAVRPSPERVYRRECSAINHIQNSWTEMGGKQIVVFLIHRQVAEALSLRPRKIDRGNLLQGLCLQGTRKGQNRKQTPKKHPSAQQFHSVTLPSPREARWALPWPTRIRLPLRSNESPSRLNRNCRSSNVVG